MRRIGTAFSTTLIYGMILCPMIKLYSAQTAVGGSPASYNSVNADAIERLNQLYRSGSISFSDYQGRITELLHPIRITDGIPSNLDGIADVIPVPQNSENSLAADSVSSANRVRHRTPAVQTSSSTASSPCPAGWTTIKFALGSPGVANVSCEQDCYNPYGKAWVITTYGANSDGTPFVSTGGTGEPRFGEMDQSVYSDSGTYSHYSNYFVTNSTDMQAMINYQNHFGRTDITYQGQAPNPKDGYQLQYLDAPAHSGGDICSSKMPYYCPPPNITESPSCTQ